MGETGDEGEIGACESAGGFVSLEGGEGALVEGDVLRPGNAPGRWGPVLWRSTSGGRAGVAVGDGLRLLPKRDMDMCAGAITLMSSSDPRLSALMALLRTEGTAASSSWVMARAVWWGSRTSDG